MRYSANISGVLGRRITPIQIYPFHFPSKRAKDVHSGCFTILARRSFPKGNISTGWKEKVFSELIIHLKKYWGMNIYWIPLSKKGKFLIHGKGEVRANALMGPDEISFGHLIRSWTINLWRVFIGSISIKLIRRVFDCPFPLSQEGKESSTQE